MRKGSVLKGSSTSLKDRKQPTGREDRINPSNGRNLDKTNNQPIRNKESGEYRSRNEKFNDETNYEQENDEIPREYEVRHDTQDRRHYNHSRPRPESIHNRQTDNHKPESIHNRQTDKQRSSNNQPLTHSGYRPGYDQDISRYEVTDENHVGYEPSGGILVGNGEYDRTRYRDRRDEIDDKGYLRYLDGLPHGPKDKVEITKEWYDKCRYEGRCAFRTTRGSSKWKPCPGTPNSSGFCGRCITKPKAKYFVDIILNSDNFDSASDDSGDEIHSSNTEMSRYDTNNNTRLNNSRKPNNTKLRNVKDKPSLNSTEQYDTLRDERNTNSSNRQHQSSQRLSRNNQYNPSDTSLDNSQQMNNIDHNSRKNSYRTNTSERLNNSQNTKSEGMSKQYHPDTVYPIKPKFLHMTLSSRALDDKGIIFHILDPRKDDKYNYVPLYGIHPDEQISVDLTEEQLEDLKSQGYYVLDTNPEQHNILVIECNKLIPIKDEEFQEEQDNNFGYSNDGISNNQRLSNMSNLGNVQHKSIQRETTDEPNVEHLPKKSSHQNNGRTNEFVRYRSEHNKLSLGSTNTMNSEKSREEYDRKPTNNRPNSGHSEDRLAKINKLKEGFGRFKLSEDIEVQNDVETDLISNNIENNQDELKNTEDGTENTENIQDELKNNQDELKNNQDELKNNQDELKNNQDELKNTEDGIENNQDELKNNQDELKNTEDGIENNQDELKNNQDELKNTEDGIDDGSVFE